jgi:hypothetical protein
LQLLPALRAARTALRSPLTPLAENPALDYSQDAYVIEQSRTARPFENDSSGGRETYLRMNVQSEAVCSRSGNLRS